MGLSIGESFRANTFAYFVLAASVIELIAAGSLCNQPGVKGCPDSFYSWAVAVGEDLNGSHACCASQSVHPSTGTGSISTAFTFFFTLMTFFANSTAEKIAPFLSIFLVLLWIPGLLDGTQSLVHTAGLTNVGSLDRRRCIRHHVQQPLSQHGKRLLCVMGGLLRVDHVHAAGKRGGSS